MTILVFWRKGYALQVLADTRISGDERVYTDAGPKILLLNVQSRTSGSDRTPLHRAFGFAYAGSSLAALSAYAVVSNCLANLVRTGDDAFPSVFEIALMVEAAANCYIAESKPPARPLMFDGLVFGACQRENQMVAATICPRKIDGRWVSRAERAPLGYEDQIGMLGQSRAFFERLKAWESAGRVIDPHGIIDEMIDDPGVPTVGGARQLALSASWDVEIVPVAVPDGDGPRLKMLLAGIDVTTLPQPVGFLPGYQVHMTTKSPQD